MSTKLGLIHTSATLVPIFQELVTTYLADKDIEVFNIVDDSLIKNTIRQNKLTPDTARRVADYVGSAEQAGADFILVTCSSIGPAVEASELLTSVPVLRVDRPMADRAVKIGRKIGIIATLETTLEPTSDLVSRRAKAIGKDVELVSVCCEGAFEALMAGDAAVHDRIVAESLGQLSKQVDVILLAQASMARVVDQLEESDKRVPILASPPIAMEYLAEIL